MSYPSIHRALALATCLGLTACSPHTSGGASNPLLKTGGRYKITTNLAIETVTIQQFLGHGWYQVVGPDHQKVLFNSAQAVVIVPQAGSGSRAR